MSCAYSHRNSSLLSQRKIRSSNAPRGLMFLRGETDLMKTGRSKRSSKSQLTPLRISVWFCIPQIDMSSGLGTLPTTASWHFWASRGDVALHWQPLNHDAELPGTSKAQSNTRNDCGKLCKSEQARVTPRPRDSLPRSIRSSPARPRVRMGIIT